MLSYAFMQRAFLVGILLGLIIPLMGVVVVNRRTSTIGDALSHASLAGIGFGLLLGFSPLVGSILITILGAFAIEVVRHKFPQSGDLATAIVMSTGVGLASILSDIVPSAMKFESYLFGSIMTIHPFEVVLSAVVCFVVLVLFFTLYYPLLYLSVDPNGARLTGLPTKGIDYLFTVLLAVTIAMAARTIGALMVSSLLILPVATALFFVKSYAQTVITSMGIGVLLVIGGLTASYYLAVKPGGAIVLFGVGLFSSAWIFHHVRKPKASAISEEMGPIVDEK